MASLIGPFKRSSADRPQIMVTATDVKCNGVVGRIAILTALKLFLSLEHPFFGSSKSPFGGPWREPSI